MANNENAGSEKRMNRTFDWTPRAEGKRGEKEKRGAGGKRRVAYYARQVTRVPREYKVMGRAPRTAL